MGEFVGSSAAQTTDPVYSEKLVVDGQGSIRNCIKFLFAPADHALFDAPESLLHPDLGYVRFDAASQTCSTDVRQTASITTVRPPHFACTCCSLASLLRSSFQPDPY